MSSQPQTPSLARGAAACLILGPAIEFISILVMPTLSSNAADQYDALVHHRTAWIAWIAIDGIALLLFIGCALALAAAVAERHRVWRTAGAGVLILGLIDLVFMNGVAAVGPQIVRGGVHAAQVTALLNRIQSSPMTGIVDALSMTTSIGMILLAVGLRRSRAVPTWSVSAIIVGAIVNGAGFAAGVKPLAAAAFILLLAGFSAVAATLLRDREPDATTVSRARSVSA